MASLEKSGQDDLHSAEVLSHLELTEQLSPAAVSRMTAGLPGPLTTTQLYMLEARSAFLPSSGSGQLTDPAPSAPEQQAMIAQAVALVGSSKLQLPSVDATQIMARFESRQVSVPSPADIAFRNAHPSLLTTTTTVTKNRIIGVQSEPIHFVDGVEQAEGSGNKDSQGSDTMQPEFGAALPALAQQIATVGDPRFLRWEVVSGRKTAIFSFHVDASRGRLPVSYCCVPHYERVRIDVGRDAPAGSQEGSTLYQANDVAWRRFDGSAGYKGLLYVDPETHLIVRTVLTANLKPHATLNGLSVRTDYAVLQVGTKAGLLPVRSFTRVDLCPSCETDRPVLAVNTNYITQYLMHYQLPATRSGGQ